jgi:hypothetical protein
MHLPRVIAAAFAIVFTASPLYARTQDEIRAAKDAAVRQLDLQLELPAAEIDDNWLWHIRIPPEFMLLGLLLGLGVIAYQFKDMIPIWRMRRDRQWDGVTATEGASGEPASVTAMVAADELARQGRFVDAMHLLLLQSLTAIRERLDEPFADSLTSREILRGTRLSEAGKTSLRDIVMRVEWTYFGKHPAERRDYEACRARFDELAQSLHHETVA